MNIWMKMTRIHEALNQKGLACLGNVAMTQKPEWRTLSAIQYEEEVERKLNEMQSVLDSLKTAWEQR